MAFEVNGNYGTEEVAIKLNGGTFTKVVDLFAIFEELVDAYIAAGITKTTKDSVASEAYKPVLARHGLPVAETVAGNLFIARYLMAQRSGLLKKFEGIEADISGEPLVSPASIPV